MSVFWCAKETTRFVSDTATDATLKQNVGDSSSRMFFFLIELGVWGLMGYSFFLSVQEHGCKILGNPLITIFSRGFYLKLHFSMVYILHSYLFHTG